MKRNGEKEFDLDHQIHNQHFFLLNYNLYYAFQNYL